MQWNNGFEWVKCNDRLPDDQFKIYRIQTKNGVEHKALFMPDMIEWIRFYGQQLTHWMDFDSGKLIYNVAEWKEYINE